MESIFHPASSRGHANHGWLDTYHSFSFAGWFNPDKIHFGALRVLNDDLVAIGEGFGTHPHDNMEIVSIPLQGVLEHKDSTGAKGLIHNDEVQIMSAGTGVLHSEYNGSKTEPVNFLQIWVFPKVENIAPRYSQMQFDLKNRHNKWQILVSPDIQDKALWINQDSIFARANLSESTSLRYSCKFAGSCVYFFLIDGKVEIEGQTLNKRDALGLRKADSFDIKALSSSDLLAIEVPDLT
ncbi:MAG: pirin family protein [Prevotellaceae bacterium]|jgi:redox-sensitive bicupin YhaK (pirin superfamily)|nr:pirin family protein [Prevotellaceae bacterium]